LLNKLRNSHFILNNCQQTHQKWKLQEQQQKNSHSAAWHALVPHGDLHTSDEYSVRSRRSNKQTGREHEGEVGEGSLGDILSLPGSYSPLFPIASCSACLSGLLATVKGFL